MLTIIAVCLIFQVVLLLRSLGNARALPVTVEGFNAEIQRLPVSVDEPVSVTVTGIEIDQRGGLPRVSGIQNTLPISIDAVNGETIERGRIPKGVPVEIIK